MTTPGEPRTGGEARALARHRLRIAVIDHEPGFTQVLSNRLEAIGWELHAFPNAPSAERLAALRLGALVVDPVVLGPLSWEYLELVCSRMPLLVVIICTGQSTVAARIRGLRLGADAWLTKPCHAEEVICVTEAAVRRYRRGLVTTDTTPVVLGELTLRPDLYQAFVDETSLELTAREFEVLNALALSNGAVRRREELYEQVWGYEMKHGDRSIDIFVRKLRGKLRVASPGWSYIHTHVGVGYRVAPVPERIRSLGASRPSPCVAVPSRKLAAAGGPPSERYAATSSRSSLVLMPRWKVP